MIDLILSSENVVTIVHDEVRLDFCNVFSIREDGQAFLINDLGEFIDVGILQPDILNSPMDHGKLIRLEGFSIAKVSYLIIKRD